MITIITICQIVSAVILMVLVLIQNRGGGLGSVFGGSDVSSVYRTKRGMEKNLHLLTIIFAILFIGLSLANIFGRT